MPQWKQYSGIWTTTQQAQAVADGTWTGLVFNELYVWGPNTSGQLGVNSTAWLSSPTQIDTGTDWITPIGFGRQNAGFVTKSSGLYAMGANNRGQLGINNTTYKSSPTQVASASTWTSAHQGENLTVLIKGDGTLWACGLNGQGQVGNSTAGLNFSSPVQIGALTTWTAGVGNDNCAAGMQGGKLYTWGIDDTYGQRAQNSNSTTAASSPVQVGALTDWSKLAAGKQFYIAVKTDGTLWGWGKRDQGQVGNNTQANGGGTGISSPVQIGALTNWASVFCGYDHAGAVKTDGTLWCWGKNSTGQLGVGSTINRSSPVQVGALTDWVKYRAGEATSIAERTGGYLWAFGNLSGGQAGNNGVTTGNINSPVQVANGESWYSWEAWRGITAIKRTTT